MPFVFCSILPLSDVFVTGIKKNFGLCLKYVYPVKESRNLFWASETKLTILDTHRSWGIVSNYAKDYSEVPEALDFLHFAQFLCRLNFQ